MPRNEEAEEAAPHDALGSSERTRCYQRPDLRWATPDQSKTFARKTDAEAWARKVESELERGVWRDTAEAERTTLAEALERYGREVTSRKKGAEQEAYKVRALRELPLARKSLASIRGADIASFRDAELARLAPSSVVK